MDVEIGWPWPVGTPPGDAWREAGEAWGKRLDAERVRGLKPGSPDWRLFALILADEEVMPAALAAIGYPHRVATFIEAPGWWPDAAGPILIMAEGDEAPPSLAAEAWLGRWRYLPECGVTGADIPELAAHRWGVTPGRAAFQLARLLGRDVPRVRAA